MKDILKSDNGGTEPAEITLEAVTGTSLEDMQAAVQLDGYYMFRLDRIEPEAMAVPPSETETDIGSEVTAVQSAIETINDFFTALGIDETWREAFTGYVDDPAIDEQVLEDGSGLVFTPYACKSPGDLVYSTAAFWALEWQSDNRPVYPTNSSTLLNFDLPDGSELTVGVSREVCLPAVENSPAEYAFVFDANVHRVQIPA